MSEQRFVVEITRPVPPEQVDRVARQIATRLELDPERIVTLLDGRIGAVPRRGRGPLSPPVPLRGLTPLPRTPPPRAGPAPAASPDRPAPPPAHVRKPPPTPRAAKRTARRRTHLLASRTWSPTADRT